MNKTAVFSGFLLLLGACVQPTVQATAGYEPIDASGNEDIKRNLPAGVSAKHLLLDGDTCYHYKAAGKVVPVLTEAGQYCIG